MMCDATEDRWDSQPFHRVDVKEAFDIGSLRWYRDRFSQHNEGFDPEQSEENTIRTWQNLIAKYKIFMPKPFREIDHVTLERRDAPTGIRVFSEAAMNLLIHQDCGDHSRKATIKFFRDGIQFWNPGDVFGDDSHLLDPGEKEVRNPGIVSGMRRIIMCEQAGTTYLD